MNSRKTDFPRWIAWSSVGAMALTSLMLVFSDLPPIIGNSLFAFSAFLLLLWIDSSLSEFASLLIAAGCYLLFCAGILLPLLFRPIKWKIAAAAISMAWAGMVLVLSLWLWAFWGG